MKTSMDLPSLMDLPIQILMNLPNLKTYIPVHLRDITDITNQLNLLATQGNVWDKLVKKLNMIDKSITLVPVLVLILGIYGLTTYLKENKGRKEQRKERS